MLLSRLLRGGLLVLPLLASPLQAADPKAKKPSEFLDVTPRIQVEFTEGLRSPEATSHEVFVTLTNSSKTALNGPLAIVLDKRAEQTFTFAWHSDTFADGQQYHALTDIDETLKSQEASRRRKIYLKTAEPLTARQREAFTLSLKVVQLSEEHLASKKPVDEQVAGKKYDRAELDRALEIQDRAAEKILSEHREVGMVSLGEDDAGNLQIQVHAEHRGAARGLPGNVEGVPVQTIVSGTFRHFAAPKPSGIILPKPPAGAAPKSPVVASPKAPVKPFAPGGPPPLPSGTILYPNPIPIGVTAFNSDDGCASGTFGCRLVDRAGNLYMLSNNHVFSAQNAGVVGETIVHPSPGDNACVDGGVVGVLSQFKFVVTVANTATLNVATMPINYMDAAIAITNEASAGFATPTGAYGTPGNTNVTSPAIKTVLRKMGRTTGFTKGFLAGLNGKVIIGYGGGNNVARFDRCLVIQTSQSGTFGAPGDSGSLVVTQNGNLPVGLLFAGSSAQTLLNPINLVTLNFNVSVDNGTKQYVSGASGRTGVALGPKQNGVDR
jgi:hypothetical protein